MTTTTITNGTDVIAPDLMLGYVPRRPTRAVPHSIIGRPNPDVTFQPTETRRGTLDLLFADEAAAALAGLLLAQATVWTLTDTTRTSITMVFVVADGDLETELDDTSRELWVLHVPYVEVNP